MPNQRSTKITSFVSNVEGIWLASACHFTHSINVVISEETDSLEQESTLLLNYLKWCQYNGQAWQLAMFACIFCMFERQLRFLKMVRQNNWDLEKFDIECHIDQMRDKFDEQKAFFHGLSFILLWPCRPVQKVAVRHASNVAVLWCRLAVLWCRLAR